MMNNQQLLSFSLKGFTFITAGERSVTCGEKVMTPTNNISNTQEQVFQSWMASCLAMTKCVLHHDAASFVQCVLASEAKPSSTAPKSPKEDLQSVPT